jgi:micrococcal nuclease
MFQYEAVIKRVVDGDTLLIDLDLGFHVRLQETVRLVGINTPETVGYDAGGIRDPAQDFIFSHCPPGSVVVANITRKEKYGRWLAVVLYLPGSVNRDEILRNPRVLNDDLVKQGLAKLYDGGKK